MVFFGLGILCGGLLAVLLLALTLRIIGRTQQPRARRADQPGNERWDRQPDLTLTISRSALEHFIRESLRDLALPLISLRDPQIRLEPDALLQLIVRGDTALLGAQLIVLRMRITPAEIGVRVQTESAGLRGLGEVAGPLTAKLDERINAALAERLALASQLEVLDVGGSDESVTISARLRDA
jgi:hypothetical protein